MSSHAIKHPLAFSMQRATYLRCAVTGYMTVQVGQVFHPEQDRIVSVRECARAQVRFIEGLCTREVVAERCMIMQCQ